MKQIIQAVIFLLFPVMAWCQAGKVDRSFGKNGKAYTKVADSGMATLHALALQADNKIIAAGNAQKAFTLTRYNTDGSADKSFGVKGILYTALNDYAAANAVAVQPDGKIVAAGYTKTGSISSVLVIRYSADGTLDESFGVSGIVTGKGLTNENAYDIVVEPGGKILVAGFTDTGIDRNILLMRFNKDGSTDNTFGNQGRVSVGFSTSFRSLASSLALQSDGKIVAGGATNTSNFFGANGILLRFNTDGSIDAGFGENGKAEFSSYYCEVIKDIVIQEDGAILVAGTMLDFEGTSNLLMAGRILPNGEIDYSYGLYADGTAYLNFERGKMTSIALQQDGKAVATGIYFGTAWMVRLTTAGYMDDTFGEKGMLSFSDEDLYSIFSIDPQNPVMIEPDGKIVTGGTYAGNYFLLTRLLGDGTGTKSGKEIVAKLLSAGIYPNPVAGNLFIKGLNSLKPASITITGMGGNILKHQNLAAGQAAINVSTLQAGRYIAVIQQEGKMVSLLFIKQ